MHHRRFWFKPHVEVLKIFLGIPTKNELVIRVYKHLLLCIGTMTAYTLGCDVRGALSANQGAHVVHTLTQVSVV